MVLNKGKEKAISLLRYHSPPLLFNKIALLCICFMLMIFRSISSSMSFIKYLVVCFQIIRLFYNITQQEILFRKYVGNLSLDMYIIHGIEEGLWPQPLLSVDLPSHMGCTVLGNHLTFLSPRLYRKNSNHTVYGDKYHLLQIYYCTISFLWLLGLLVMPFERMKTQTRQRVVGSKAKFIEPQQYRALEEGGTQEGCYRSF